MVAPAKCRVFVVDDEPIIAHTLAAILNQQGFESTAYTSPFEALRNVESVRPDLVITDVAMPEMNGIHLGIKIKTLMPECNVLLFSGQALTSNLLEEARSLGHNFVLLNKPIHPRDLLAAISAISPVEV